jgi:hypothetical protein
MGIVQLTGTVITDADEETMVPEGLAPFFVQERAPGWHGVLEAQARPLLSFLGHVVA